MAGKCAQVLGNRMLSLEATTQPAVTLTNSAGGVTALPCLL
jgi:hypothetical protein